MNKFVISLVTLATLSTASFASYRDITTSRGAVDTHKASTVSVMNALAIHGVSKDKAGDDLGLGGSNRR